MKSCFLWLQEYITSLQRWNQNVLLPSVITWIIHFLRTWCEFKLWMPEFKKSKREGLCHYCFLWCFGSETSVSEDLYISKKVLKIAFWREMASSVNRAQYIMNAQPETLSPSFSISLGDLEDFAIGPWYPSN